jgi:TatD DNase family protein
MLVDTHCHIETHGFPEGAEAVMARAAQAGVAGFVVVGVGETLENAERAVALAERHDNVVAAVAFHPHDAAKVDEASERRIGELVRRPRVVSVGEIGLDYHYDHSPRDVQKDVFRRFIALARDVKKPIVIHTREAAADTLAILKEENARDVGGVIHCFSEDRAFAEVALELGFYISFSGIVTFKNAKDIQDVAGWAPADRILVETDAPYLAPIPFRGKRCEPAYVAHTAKKIAELRAISIDEVEAITTENAKRLFGDAMILA